jgi:hypothetical protein
MSREISDLTHSRGTIQSEDGIKEVIPGSSPGNEFMRSNEIAELRGVLTLLRICL